MSRYNQRLDLTWGRFVDLSSMAQLEARRAHNLITPEVPRSKRGAAGSFVMFGN